MRRSGLVVTAAVMLSMVPAVPPALAAPFYPNPAVMTSDSGSIMEVSHRRKYRKHCHHDIRRHGGGWHRHRIGNCKTLYVRRHHRHHRGHSGACIRFNGFTVCF